MNYGVLLKLHSIILVILGVAFALTTGVSFALDPGHDDSARNAFILCSLLTFTFAYIFYAYSSESGDRLFRKEALAVIGTGWIMASFIGAFPYFIVLPNFTFADAIFESASGFTTTGATVLANIEVLPPSMLFWRAITQYIGGLGVVVFFVAILSFLGAGAKVLFSRESTAQATDLDSSRIQKGVLKLCYVYIGLSIACTVAYRYGGMSWFDAITHMFTTVSTGGFSTKNDSFSAFNSPMLEWTAVIFMALGGTSFLVFIKLWHGDWKSVRNFTEVRVYYWVLILASVIVAYYLLAFDWTNDFHQAIRDAAFQVVSIMTTTGFVTADFDRWAIPAETILLLLMVVGGCSGSTSGGTKVVRFVIATKVIIKHVEKAFRSRVVRPLSLNRQPLNIETQENVMVFIVLIWFITLASFFVVALLEPNLSLLGNISVVLATLYNIGPAFAEVGPIENFGGLNSGTKFFLSILMIMGRLELFAILVLFAPSLWRKF